MPLRPSRKQPIYHRTLGSRLRVTSLASIREVTGPVVPLTAFSPLSCPNERNRRRDLNVRVW